MFDLIGDVHGCLEELKILLDKLQPNRQIIFVGDLIDRGPDSVGVLKLVMSLVTQDKAQCVLGNHDDKLYRFLKGNNVVPKHGLKETISQIEKEPKSFQKQLFKFLDSLPYQLNLDEGRLHVSHAGLPEKLQGVDNSKTRSHALYGDVDGSVDHNGLPIRKDWAQKYTGQRVVVHGHVPVKEVTIKNNVWDIDTGIPFGNKLTALRYPEMELVQVPALKNYQPDHPF